MYYTKLGKIPRKRHIIFRKDDGSLYREQLVGLEGFSGISSLLYKEQYPSSTVRLAPLGIDQSENVESSKTLDYWHLRTAQMLPAKSPLLARFPLLYNSQCQISVSIDPMNYLFRNASHHELYFIDEGRGSLYTEYGVIDFVPGDYLVIPKCTTYQFKFEAHAKYLMVQSTAPYRFPSRYLNRMGQFLEHSPVCERDIRPPSRLEPVFDESDTPIILHRNGIFFEQVMNHHPFDTIGWDGYLYPYAISIHDFEPIVGSLHMPPPVHQMFASDGFVICNFVPRLFDFHKEAVPAPYYHSNVDSDEVIYYVEGDFMSRSGIEKGSITLHPAGLTHGPQPGKTEASLGAIRTNELAVMIDTYKPLYVNKNTESIKQSDYSESWLEKRSVDD